jgi:serine protease
MKPNVIGVVRVSFSLLLVLSCTTVGRAASATQEVGAIVIKFKDSAFVNTTDYKVQPAVRQQIKVEAPQAALRPMIDPTALAKLENTAQQRGFANDLKTTNVPVRNYFALRGTFSPDISNVVASLNTIPEIEKAYRAPAASNPMVPATPTGTLYIYQFYLNDAPRGVGAKTAWTLVPSGACGAGMRVVDLEMGWSLTHTFYNTHSPTKLGGNILSQWKGHGTSVLGIICANNNGSILGVAPHVSSVKVISYSGDSTLIGNAITKAANDLTKNHFVGGVLVIEAQLDPKNDGKYLPVETDESLTIYYAIYRATAAGVVVIEAAGNGNINLDSIPALNRCSGTGTASPFLDSGAIMVAASEVRDVGGVTVWPRWLTSNYGSRIDCFAEGRGVTTADYPIPPGGSAADAAHREDFSGTSSATAIIAGVALSAQGMYKATTGSPLDGVRLRRVLTSTSPINNVTFGVVPPPLNCSASGAIGEWIGVMPDLVKIQSHLGVIP